jgi:hypothetical protein
MNDFFVEIIFYSQQQRLNKDKKFKKYNKKLSQVFAII